MKNIEYEYEENYTLLRELKENDVFITKINTEVMYLKNIGDDKHILKDLKNGYEYEVPHGRFPIFKKTTNILKEITIGELHEIYQKYGNLGFKVETPYGYKDIEWCGITEENADVYRCELENGMFVEGADLHKLKNDKDEFITLNVIQKGELIQTKNGNSPVSSIELLEVKDTLYDVQVAEVKQYYTNGIVSHNTTFTIDAIKFLLHGSTTKTDTNAEIFNTYSGKNELVVRGMINIEGDEFIIERKMKRSQKKTGEWNVTNKVNYYAILPDGTEEEQNEEDAKKTTKKLKEAVGSEKDFELLVLATEKNLDDLIGLTTTESGKVLTRLIGLEILELKEAVVRKMYNEFNGKKKSNTYDVITLGTEIEEHNSKIVEGGGLETLLKDKLEESKNELIRLNGENDRLLNSKEKVDVSIAALNPSKLEGDIATIIAKGVALKDKVAEITTRITDMGVIVFDEDSHHSLTKELSTEISKQAVKEAEVIRLKRVVSELIAGGICQSCNRKLDDVDNTEHIKKHEEQIRVEQINIGACGRNIGSINKDLGVLNKTKLFIDEKNRLELDKDRLEVEMGGLRNQVVAKRSDLDKYKANLFAIEFNKKVEIDVSMVKTSIAVCNHTKDDTITRIERVQTDIKGHSVNIEIKTKLIETIKKEEEVDKIFKVYIDLVGKKGVSKLVLRSVLPIINSEIQRLLEDVTDFEIEIFMDDKNDVQFLIIKDEVAKPLKSGSGLEKTAASLALRAILGKISTLPMPNFITFDEVLGKVAPENIEKLKPLFDKIKDMYDIVFLITHNDLIKDWSTNIVTVIKENNISKINIK